MKHLFSDEVTDSEISAFLIGLKMKGETIEEIAGLVKEFVPMHCHLERFLAVWIIVGREEMDLKTFNISSTSAFVIAAAGIPVAKHGNRSVSSKSGSADVLEELGIQLNLSEERLAGNY